MTTQLNGQFDLSSAKEGAPLPATTDIASFTDANQTDTASAFTATIVWGDGTTTTGTVVGSNGSFSVEGGHTYADEAFENASVTIVRTADSSQLVLSGTVPVDDADDNLTGHGAPTISGNPNQALTNVTVATFTDSDYPNNVASDFTVSIDWGDGVTTGGTISGGSGTFTVTGSHTYATAGDFTVTTFMNDDFPDAASAVATTTAAMGFGGTETLQSATEFTAVASGTQVAVFVDNSGLPATDYTAMIDWGDGTTTAGSVSGSNGSFTVMSASAHTYADEGLFTLTAHIERTTDFVTTAASGTVTVADADVLNASGTTLHGIPNQALTNVTVATFSDTLTGNVASDFAATIDWGDGTTDTGTISGSAGAFTVSGSHTYAQNGKDTITVDVNEDAAPGVATSSAEATSTAIIGVAPGTGFNLSALEGTPIASGTQVATFSDGNTSDTASAFTAAINWGDGTTDTGTISGSNGSFTVTTAGHTYSDEGSDTVTTTVTRTADHEQAAMAGQATVGETDNFTVTGDNVSGNPGQALNNVQVATFTDAFTGQVASDLIATINWGDGASSAGTIAGGGGTFTVFGSHTYTTGGNHTFTVTVNDDAPGTAIASGSATAAINFGGQVVLTSATEHVALPGNTSVATFSDSNLSDTAGSFTATINWGDGATTAGTVVGSNGSFTVEGAHTYADEGNDQARVTVTHTADQVQSTFSGSVAVAEHDFLGSQGGGVTLNGGQASIAAHFSDTDTVTSASDLIGTINWGDGTTTAGTVSGSNGLFTVNGTHTYSGSAPFTATVTLADDAPGTATSSLSVQVNPPPPAGTTANMITVRGSDGTYEIYDLGHNTELAAFPLTQISAPSRVVALGNFSGSDTTDVAVRNGTAFQFFDVANNNVTQTGVMGAVGTEWSVVGTGKFDSTSFTDLMMEKTTGTVDTFETLAVRNNQFAGANTIATVGTEWQLIGFGDVNGDGTTDMVLRDTNNGTMEYYDIANGQLASDGVLGAVGTEWQPVGFGNFDNSGSSDLIMRDSNNGAYDLYVIRNNQIMSAHQIAAVGSEWQLAGFADLNGDGTTDMVLRNSNNGTFEYYDIANGQVTAEGVLGQSGPEWTVVGLANAPKTAASANTSNGLLTSSASTPDGAGGWLTPMMPTAPSGIDNWLTQAMQTPPSDPNAAAVSGPGFGANADAIAGDSVAVWAAGVTPNPLQAHTA